jgi:hypothetical protein
MLAALALGAVKVLLCLGVERLNLLVGSLCSVSAWP